MAQPRWRALNRDGSDNIDRSEMVRGLNDLYHILLSVRPRKFVAVTLASYFAINLFFGILYFLAGEQGLNGARPGAYFFVDCFFFSIQTFSTIGYGTMSPHTIWVNILVAVEAFTGMMSVAVMSGLLFARFSRPTARVKFSNNALITQHRGKRCLVFRMANARLNQVAEAQVSVVLLRTTQTPEGQSMRTQYDLPLMRQRSLFFAASWVVAHVIDENSPLYHMNAQKLEEESCEIFVSLMGYDETFSQTIHARFSYLFDEILWDRQFADIVTNKEGKILVNIERISDLQPTTH